MARHRFSLNINISSIVWQKIQVFCQFTFFYLKKKTMRWALSFENKKSILVRFFMLKRGRYNRPFLHLSAIIVLFMGVMLAPFLADTYPIFSAASQASSKLNAVQTQKQSITLDSNVFETKESEKPRDQILTYMVEKGDTVSTIAQKFGISTETIKWGNSLTTDDITVGDTLKIMPVTGIAHKVAKGDTVYTIAKTYDTNPQKIVDFPFNDFANPETFSLVAGQILIVPDGVKPEEKKTYQPRQVYIAQGPVPVAGGGFTWPLTGEISQFASWYHMALDVTSPVGTPIVAANSGTVVRVSTGTWDGGYGNNVTIDKGDGVESHYAHMSSVNVGVGDSVMGGKTVIGWVGLTGRTTGSHLHFEIRRGGALVNPLPYLQ